MIKREEHAYIKINRDIKTGSIPGLVVLHGAEDYLVSFYGDYLIRTFTGESTRSLDLVTLDREDVTIDSIIENLETISLMSRRKVLYLPDFIDSRGRYPKSIEPGTKAFDDLLDYMGQIPEDALLLICLARQEDERSEHELNRSKLMKTAADKGAVYDFDPLDMSQLRGFIDKRLRSSSKSYRPALVDMIARESGYINKNIDYGLYSLDNDLRKIIAHSGVAEEITDRDVTAVIAVNPENNIFAMLDSIGKNKKDEAFRLLHNLIIDGSSEFQILSMITKQLEMMLVAREMKDEGMPLASIQKALKKSDGFHEFRTKKALEAASRFRADDLKRVLSSAYEVEVNIKTGLMPGPLALEFFIAGI